MPQNFADAARWFAARRRRRLRPGAVPPGQPQRKGRRPDQGPAGRAPALSCRRRQGPRQGHAQSRRALCRGHRRQARLQGRGRMVPQGGGLRRHRQPVQSWPSFTPAASASKSNLAESYRWFALAAAKRRCRRRPQARRGRSPARPADACRRPSSRSQTFVAEREPDEAASLKAPPGGWDHAPAQPVKPAGRHLQPRARHRRGE